MERPEHADADDPTVATPGLIVSQDLTDLIADLSRRPSVEIYEEAMKELAAARATIRSVRLERDQALTREGRGLNGADR